MTAREVWCKICFQIGLGARRKTVTFRLSRRSHKKDRNFLSVRKKSGKGQELPYCQEKAGEKDRSFLCHLIINYTFEVSVAKMINIYVINIFTSLHKL